MNDASEGAFIESTERGAITHECVPLGTAAAFTATLAEVIRLTAELEEWKAAATRHHPNPADYRYWEGRYRDEKAAKVAAEAEVARLIAERDAARVPEGMTAVCSGTRLSEARGKLHDLLCLPKDADLSLARQWAQEAYDLLPVPVTDLAVQVLEALEFYAVRDN